MILLSPIVLKAIAENAARIDSENLLPEQEFHWLASDGLLQFGLPGKPLDFSSPDTASLLQLLKEVGRANLSVGRIYEGHVNALQLIHLFASDKQKKVWYAAASRNELFGIWNTQDESGVQLHDLGDGRYRIEGCKTFCSGAGLVQRPIITGQLISTTRQGWQMCILQASKIKEATIDKGFWHPLGMRASASHRIDFRGIEISEDDLLGEPDTYYRQPNFGSGAVRFAAVQLGGAEAIMRETVRYLKSLQRTGDLFQQARIAEMACLIESGNLYLSSAGSKIDEWKANGDESIQKILAYANMTRAMTEEACLRSMQLAERCVGAKGLLRPSPLERLHRDLTFYLRQPAPDAALTGIGNHLLQQDETDDCWK